MPLKLSDAGLAAVTAVAGRLLETKKSPRPGGQARPNKLLVSWGPLVIAAPLAGSLLAPLRCAGVSVLAWGSQHVSGPSSVSPTRMQAS